MGTSWRTIVRHVKLATHSHQEQQLGLPGFYYITDIIHAEASENTAKLPDAVYVLHVFQKKSKSGIATPKPEIALIRQRLQMALELSRESTKKPK